MIEMYEDMFEEIFEKVEAWLGKAAQFLRLRRIRPHDEEVRYVRSEQENIDIAKAYMGELAEYLENPVRVVINRKVLWFNALGSELDTKAAMVLEEKYRSDDFDTIPKSNQPKYIFNTNHVKNTGSYCVGILGKPIRVNQFWIKDNGFTATDAEVADLEKTYGPESESTS